MSGEITTQIILEIAYSYKQLLGKGPNWVTIDTSRDIAIVRIKNNLCKAQALLVENQETLPIITEYIKALEQEAILPEIVAICEKNWRVKVRETATHRQLTEKLSTFILFMDQEIEV